MSYYRTKSRYLGEKEMPLTRIDWLLPGKLTRNTDKLICTGNYLLLKEILTQKYHRFLVGIKEIVDFHALREAGLLRLREDLFQMA